MQLIEQLRWWAAECDRTNFGCQARKLLLEAAEALEKAEPVNATDTNVGSKWIPVTERLPEEDGDLYIVTAYNEEIWWNRVVVLCAEYYRGSWTWNENGREWDLTGSVTNWMPLPEPPKMDGGAGA